MRTENGPQENKTTRRAQGEGRKRSTTKKPTPKAPTTPKNSTRARSARKAQAAQKPQAQAIDPRTLDAEEMVDRIGAQIGRFATLVGHELLRAAARAREEVEDMVAEAQSIRDTIQGDEHGG